MKLDITRDVQRNNVLELSDAELAVVIGAHGTDHDHWHEHGHDHWHGWWGQNDWQGSDYFGGYNSQQVIFVQQQSAPYEVIQSSCY